jgi:type VI secretion system protein ImpH
MGGEATNYSFANLVYTLSRKLDPTHQIGTTASIEHEPILFRSTPSLGFPASDVSSVLALSEEGRLPWPVQVDVSFLGLYGPSSPLPAFWTERIIRADDGSENLRDFMDLFGHPLIGLAYRIGHHYRIDLQLADDIASPTMRAILSLAGIAGEQSLIGDGLEWRRLLPLCGLLAQHSRSAETVRRVVSGYFDVPVQIEEWVPRKVDIPIPQLFTLGSPALALGRNTVIGGTVRDISGCVVVALGPLSSTDFEAFLPGGDRRKPLEALLRLALREPLECQIDLIRDGENDGFALGMGRIGWTTWQSGGSGTMRCTAGSI